MDFDLAYNRSFGRNRIGVNITASWTPSYLRQSDSFDPAVQNAGYSDGPLGTKGRAALTWHRGNFGATFDAQYYSAYSVALANDNLPYDANAYRVYVQGSNRIPAQAERQIHPRFPARHKEHIRRNATHRRAVANRPIDQLAWLQHLWRSARSPDCIHSVPEYLILINCKFVGAAMRDAAAQEPAIFITGLRSGSVYGDEGA